MVDSWVSARMADECSQEAWESWVDSSLNAIRSKKLERVLRPLIPTGSSVEVRSSNLAPRASGSIPARSGFSPEIYQLFRQQS